MGKRCFGQTAFSKAIREGELLRGWAFPGVDLIPLSLALCKGCKVRALKRLQDVSQAVFTLLQSVVSHGVKSWRYVLHSVAPEALEQGASTDLARL